MARTLILINGHLCNAPRAQKEADALSSAGHDVTVHGVWAQHDWASEDKALAAEGGYEFVPAIDIRTSPGNSWNRTIIRAARKKALIAFRTRKRFSPDLFGYAAHAQFRKAIEAGADLTIVHSPMGLWIGKAMIEAGHRVAVDFEDWYSRDLLMSARRDLPISELEELESEVLRRACYCTTTSAAMAAALAKAYAVEEPEVIYNCFPWSERSSWQETRKDRSDDTIPSVHWFSQTIGPGRGLEMLLAALPQLSCAVQVHLRGVLPRERHAWLENLIPESHRNRVFVHPRVPNEELGERIREHDIGLALEPGEPENKNLTVSNKLFQYMQAGLAIIATNTAGQSEILRQTQGAGHLLSAAEPHLLAKAIDWYVSHPDALAKAKQASLDAARDTFNWEKQAPIVVKKAASALDPAVQAE